MYGYCIGLQEEKSNMKTFVLLLAFILRDRVEVTMEIGKHCKQLGPNTLAYIYQSVVFDCEIY